MVLLALAQFSLICCSIILCAKRPLAAFPLTQSTACHLNQSMAQMGLILCQTDSQQQGKDGFFSSLPQAQKCHHHKIELPGTDSYLDCF